MEKQLVNMANKMLKDADIMLKHLKKTTEEVNYEGLTPEQKAFFQTKMAEVKQQMKKADMKGDNSKLISNLQGISSDVMNYIKK